MSSRREAANRANAAKSTGPRTAAGKSASSRNATTHGLTASGVLLPSEDPREFAALESAIASNYGESPFVTPLVHQLAAVMWRLARLRRIEALSLMVRFGGRMSQGVEDPQFGHTFTMSDLPKKVDDYTTVQTEARRDITAVSADLLNLSRYESTLFNQMMRLLNFLEPYAIANQGADDEPASNGLALRGAAETGGSPAARSRDDQSAA